MEKVQRVHVTGETWGVFEHRLRRTGLYEAYKDRCAQLRLEGIRPKKAREQAMLEYGPPGGSPTSAVAPAVAPAVGGRPSGGEGGASNPNDGTNLFLASGNEDAAYAALAIAAKSKIAGQGKESAEAVEVRWVAANMELPLAEIEAASVPSSAAVSLLRWARTIGGRSEFFRSVWSKLLPTRSLLDKSPFMDDGESVLAVLQQFVAGTKGGQEESAAEGMAADDESYLLDELSDVDNVESEEGKIGVAVAAPVERPEPEAVPVGLP